MSRFRSKDGQFTDDQHRRAERFALGIMLPTEPFLRAMEELNGDTVEVSRRFQVPVSAVHKKLQALEDEA